MGRCGQKCYPCQYSTPPAVRRCNHAAGLLITGDKTVRCGVYGAVVPVASTVQGDERSRETYVPRLAQQCKRRAWHAVRHTCSTSGKFITATYSFDNHRG